jgi:hypothetical protein
MRGAQAGILKQIVGLWFQTSAAMLKRIALFWDIMRKVAEERRCQSVGNTTSVCTDIQLYRITKTIYLQFKVAGKVYTMFPKTN